MRQSNFLLTIGLVLVCTTPGARAATITVDSTVTHQTITGWEAVAQVGNAEERDAFAQYRDTIYRHIARDGLINRLRLEIAVGEESDVDLFTPAYTAQDWSTFFDTRYHPVNDNADPFDINWDGFQFAEFDTFTNQIAVPFRQELLARGDVPLINLCVVDFDPWTFEHRTDPQEYAEFVVATYIHMDQTFGFVPDYFEVKLEPDIGDHWTANEVADCALAACQRLEDSGYVARTILP